MSSLYKNELTATVMQLFFMMFVCISQSSHFILAFRQRFGHVTKSHGNRRYLNRLLFETNEIEELQHRESQRKIQVGTLREGDSRYSHIINILKLEHNDPIKAGIINQGLVDAAKVWYHFPEELVPSSSIQYQEDRKQPRRLWIALGSAQDFQSVPRPKIDLILAVPRPLRLEKILTMVACLGVDRLLLVNAKKVAKEYFGSHLLLDQRQAEMKQLLFEGLSQAGVDYHLPEVHICRYVNITVFHRLFGAEDFQQRSLKLIAHPVKGDGLAAESLLSLYQQQQREISQFERVIIAIGPEGGWEVEEIQAYEKNGFHCVHLGSRILRTLSSEYSAGNVESTAV